MAHASFPSSLALAASPAAARRRPRRCPLTVWYRPAALDAAHATGRRSSSARGTAGRGPGCAPSTPSPPPTAPSGARRPSSCRPGTYHYSILAGDRRVADELNPRTSLHRRRPDDPSATRSRRWSSPTATRPTLAAIDAHADGDALVVEADFAPRRRRRRARRLDAGGDADASRRAASPPPSLVAHRHRRTTQ